MIRKKEKIRLKPGGAPGWMTTFGDMNILLLVFFIAMLTDATIEGRDIRLMLSPFKNSTGMLEGGNTLTPGPLAEGGLTMESLPSKDLGTGISKSFKDVSQVMRIDLDARDVKLSSAPKGFQISLSSDIFFRPGSAEIEYENGKVVLKKLGLVLQGLNNKAKIEVVGHTDNQAIPKDSMMVKIYPSNWELSSARASTVVRHLVLFGVSTDNIVAEGRGEFDPVEDNNKPEGRKLNRRIDIIITSLSE